MDTISKYVAYTVSTHNIVAWCSNLNRAREAVEKLNGNIGRVQYEAGFVKMNADTLEFIEAHPSDLSLPQKEGFFK